MQDTYEVPYCDTHGRFFDESGNTAHRPNMLANTTSRLDETAVFSVLQFGAIIPPLSPWQGVQRFLPGYQYHGIELVGPVKLERPTHVATLDPEQQSDEIQRLLDRILRRLIGNRQDPVLLFSGGIDSGLIASRLAALGYRDSLLLNYSFREEDPESRHAEAMAKHLGLRFERILAKRNLCHCLIEPGCVYPQPIGDPSTVPTWDLAHSAVNHLAGEHRLILDGLGPDQAFGRTNRIDLFSRVIRVPQLLSQAASVLYSSIFWHRYGRLEYLFRVLRRSNLSLVSAVLAQNPLAGTLYRNASKRPVDSLLSDWVGGWVGDSLKERIVAADLALYCSNAIVQKGQPIFELAGHEVAHPFLETEMVSLAIASIPHWQMDEPKAPLKRCLARYVPRDMVYRPKSGFVDYRGTGFFDKEFIAYLRAAADDTSPMAFILNKKPLLKACDWLSRRVRLPFQTLNCLWAITFVDRWYRSAREDVCRASTHTDRSCTEGLGGPTSE
jgi:asparagine synthetase B (glutamine-hydrolysing)